MLYLFIGACEILVVILVQVMAIIWANFDPNLHSYMASLGQARMS